LGALEVWTVKLTKRELDVMTLMVQDLGNREIAEHLGISIQTVKTHRKHAYEKLDAHTPVDAALKFLFPIEEFPR
jgi:DNA-binding CsgD family transcriptional regulator